MDACCLQNVVSFCIPLNHENTVFQELAIKAVVRLDQHKRNLQSLQLVDNRSPHLPVAAHNEVTPHFFNADIVDHRLPGLHSLAPEDGHQNAFCNPDLVTLLEQAHVGQIRLAGLYAKACVSATAKAAQKRGLSVQVIGEATACSSDKSRKDALDKLRGAGITVV